MANVLFKGFKLVTTANTSWDNDTLYFVRTNADKQDGYIRLNGKIYGSAKDVESSLKALIGTLPTGYATVVAYIEAAEQAAKSYADSAIASAITALDAEVTGASHDVKVTVTEVDGKLTAVAVEAPDFAALYDAKGAAESAKTEVIGTASTSANTLGKIETIILENEEVIASALTELNTAIEAETSARTEADNALSARIDALTGSSHSHTNKAVLDGITSEKVASWDAAEQNAKNYADSAITSAITALDAEVTGASHDVKVTVTEADGKLTAVAVEAPDFAALYDAKGAAASAETVAKAYADGKVSAETTARETRDNELYSAITAETESRASADATLGERIDTVNSALTAETTARETADTALGGRIDAEVSARTAADAALDKRIEELETISGSSHTHANKSVLDGITSEKVASWDAAEQNAKNYADSAITSAITALDATVTGSSSAVTVTVTETDGKLTAATAEVHVSAVANNALEVKSDGLFAAIYYEDEDA